MPLVLDTLNIVVRVGAGEFSMGRTVAGFAFNSAMAGRESIQRQTGCGSIGCGGKRRHSRKAKSTVGDGVGEPDLALVMNRITRVTGLTVGFVEPPGAIGRRNTTHEPVTTLALHRHRTISGDRLPHRTPQTFGRRPRMALITGCTVGGGIQCQAGRRIGHIGVTAVDGRCQRLDPRQSAARQRLAEMTTGTENRCASGGRDRQTRGIVPVRCKCRGI